MEVVLPGGVWMPRQSRGPRAWCAQGIAVGRVDRGGGALKAQTSCVNGRKANAPRLARVYLMAADGQHDDGAAQSRDFWAVAGRILDQLNPTAWLPAALVVGDLWLIAAYRLTDDTKSLIERLRTIAETLNGKPFGILVTTFLALVIVTILTQSLEFASIRFLEGYWGPSRIAAPATRAGTFMEAARRARLTRRGDVLKRHALRSALPSIRQKFGANAELVRIIDRAISGRVIARIDNTFKPDFTPEGLAKASGYIESREWLELAKPSLVRQLEEADLAASMFPEQDRLMPTRLGQTLRSAEDRLMGVDPVKGLRGYVIRNVHRISPPLLREHDQHRNQLDMYAVMSLAAALLALVNGLALWGDAALTINIVAAAILAPILLSIMAYRGAIAAAEGYGLALIEIDLQLAANGGRA